MPYIGKVLKVDKKQIRIYEIEPSLPGYALQISADAEELDLRKGQRVQFELDRRNRVVNLKVLDSGSEQSEGRSQPPVEQPSSVRDELSVLASPVQPEGLPVEYYAYIAHSGFRQEREKDWLHQNIVYALKYTITEDKKDREKVRENWQDWILENAAQQKIRSRKSSLGGERRGLYGIITRPVSQNFHLDLLPKPSFAISFRFTLAKPYISHGEESLYAIDNPIVKDAIFGLPMVRETAWKGHLRQAMRETLGGFSSGDGKIIDRLFGARDVTQADAKQGYLHFYPTFFDAISLEVINPHRRESRSGTMPILFEAVPVGKTGDFFLLYTPVVGIDPLPEHLLDEEARQHNARVSGDAQTDLHELVEAIRAMFLDYGFSAKATDGYGRACERIQQVDSIPMLQTNSRDIVPSLPWEERDGGVFSVAVFRTLDDLSELRSENQEGT